VEAERLKPVTMQTQTRPVEAERLKLAGKVEDPIESHAIAERGGSGVTTPKTPMIGPTST